MTEEYVLMNDSIKLSGSLRFRWLDGVGSEVNDLMPLKLRLDTFLEDSRKRSGWIVS